LIGRIASALRATKYAVPKVVGTQMMESFDKSLQEDVLTPLQLNSGWELRTRSTNTVLRL
jgi:hypothetical protein